MFSLDRYALGAGCVIVIWFVAAVVLGSIWLGCLLIFLFGRSRKSRLLAWLGGVPLVAITLAGIAIAGVVGFGIVRSMSPRYVYRDTFHESPTADVRHLRSKVWSFADEGHVFMRFEVSPETFRRIMPDDLQKVSYAEYRKRMPSSNIQPPSWWSPPTETTSDIYIGFPEFGLGKRFASETTLLTYDASSQTAMYFYLGID